MDTRDQVEVRTSEPDVVVSSPLPPAPPMVLEEPRGARLPLAIIGVLILLASAVGIAVAAVVSGSDDDSVAQPQSQQPADVPPAPAALSVTADGPASVAVGERATITVTYTDGSGIFSGTSEEWGDGVGTSSLQQARCSAAAAPAESLSGSYQVKHAWTEPGTYSLVLGVNTYTCRGTSTVQEQKTTMLIVKVLAR
jgi:hypothetical protein